MPSTALAAGNTNTRQAPQPPDARSLEGECVTRNKGKAVLLVL